MGKDEKVVILSHPFSSTDEKEGRLVRITACPCPACKGKEEDWLESRRAEAPGVMENNGIG